MKLLTVGCPGRIPPDRGDDPRQGGTLWVEYTTLR